MPGQSCETANRETVCPSPLSRAIPMMLRGARMRPRNPEGATQVGEDDSQGGAVANNGSNGSSVGGSPIM